VRTPLPQHHDAVFFKASPGGCLLLGVLLAAAVVLRLPLGVALAVISDAAAWGCCSLPCLCLCCDCHHISGAVSIVITVYFCRRQPLSSPLPTTAASDSRPSPYPSPPVDCCIIVFYSCSLLSVQLFLPLFIIRSSFVHRSFIVCSLFVHCSFVHSLFTIVNVETVAASVVRQTCVLFSCRKCTLFSDAHDSVFIACTIVRVG